MKDSPLDLVRADCAEVADARASTLAPLRGATLLVTGGTGFFGTWLAELVTYLNDRHAFGAQLVLVARGTDRFAAARAHLAGREDVRLVKSDVRFVIELPKETNWIIHAAANPDNRFHSSSPVETMTAIADGTLAVLRAADRCSNLKMFLNVSSGLVCGAQPLELERMPESFPGAPASGSVSSAYAEAKRYAETLCSATRSQARLPALNVRPFAFVGPYQSLDTPWAISNFIRDALAGGVIRVFGDGQTVRSYLYGSDMAFWLLRILTAGTSGLTYNLGSPNGATLERVAQLVSAQVEPRPEIRLRTVPAAAQRSRLVPDVTLAAESLDLRETVDLETAVKRTVRWHRAEGAQRG